MKKVIKLWTRLKLFVKNKLFAKKAFFFFHWIKIRLTAFQDSKQDVGCSAAIYSLNDTEEIKK